MMKTTQNKSPGIIQRTLYAIMGLALLAVMLPGIALATTAANAATTTSATEVGYKFHNLALICKKGPLNRGPFLFNSFVQGAF